DGAGVWAAQDAGVQQATRVLIVAVASSAGGLVRTVEPLNPGAEQSAFLGPRHGSASSLLFAQRVNGLAHLFVGAAAADVARQAALDLGGRGALVGLEDGLHGDDETGSAEAALLRIVLHKGGRHGVDLVSLGQRLGGADRFALGLEGEH